MHLLGIHWEETKPVIRFRKERDLSGEQQRIDFSVGDFMTIRLVGEKRCIGYYDSTLREWQPCPLNIDMTGREGAKCPFCTAREVTFYTFVGYDRAPKEVIDYLTNQEHVIYLNLFGNDIIKVGVASAYRKMTRVLEQGADATLFIGAANGFIARDIEANIALQFSIMDKVTLTRKLSLLATKQDSVHAQEILTTVLTTIKQKIPEHFGRYLYKEPEFHYNVPLYALNGVTERGEIELITSFQS